MLQHRGTRTAPSQTSTGIRLIAHLLARPIWLAGLAAAAVGLLLHAVALAQGQLIVVQPLLVSGVVFALPISGAMEGNRFTVNGVFWALLLVAGLAGFLVASDAHGGPVSVDADTLAVTTAAGVLAAAVCTGAAHWWVRRHRAVLLALAAGIGYGLTAALLKQTVAIASLGAPAQWHR